MPPKAVAASKAKIAPRKMIVLSETDQTTLLAMISGRTNDSSLELEASISNVPLDAYRRILRHYAQNTKPSRIKAGDALDINISLPHEETYRVSIVGIDQINRFIAENANSTNRVLVGKVVAMDPSDHVQIMYKDRKSMRFVNLLDYDGRIRLTRENMVTDRSQAPKITGTERVLFRFKSRYSFRDAEFSIDVSEVSQDGKLSRVFNNTRTYEVEAEVVDKVDVTRMIAIVSKLLCLIQDSDRPIGKMETAQVLASYRQLLEHGIRETRLKLRNVVSLDYRATIEDLPNKYAVTDKADGERHVFFLSEAGMYLITPNMMVKGVDGVPITTTPAILDGELIVDEHTAKKTFLAFDVIYYDRVDYLSRNKAGLRERLQVVTNAIDRSLGTSIPFREYAVAHSEMSLDAIEKYYRKELQRYWTKFEELRASTPGLLVIQKVHLIPYGIHQSEVFRYWNLIYQMYTREKLVPYQLDGIILTPVENPYLDLGKGKHVLREYRWKPPQMNTLDFYLDFVTNEAGQEIVYQEEENALTFKVARLKVGRKTGNTEAPVSFVVNGEEQMVALVMEDNEPLDAEGGIIQNKIVVEFSYDSQPDLDPKFRWKPLRIRHDKTHSVRRFGTNYGNYFDVAHSIWDSIIRPILEEHIINLAKPKKYQIQMDQFLQVLEANPQRRKGAISAGLRDRAYYSKVTSLGNGMRAFHNFVKTTMIAIYGKKALRALDIGCGRGGDLGKCDQAGIQEYVGTDLDANGLFRINGSALYRYQGLVKKGSKMKAVFLQADASVPFQSEAQSRSVPNMTAANAANIDQHLGQKFDLVNVQFAIHYFMGNATAWGNFCDNLNQTMAEGSYLLVTTLDGSLVHQQLEHAVRFGASYVTDAGAKQNLFEIRKVYSDSDPEELGVTIDFFSPILWDDGVSKPEFLVFPKFLQESLQSHCQLELVETDSFRQLFQMHRSEFLKKGKDFPGVRDFYRSLDDPEHPNHSEAMAGLQLTSLQRYYVFRKTKGSSRKGSVKLADLPAPMMSRLSDRLEGHATDLVTKYVRIDTITSYSDPKSAYRQISARHPRQKPIVYLLRYSGNDPERPRLAILKSPQGKITTAALIYRSVAGQYYLCYDVKMASKGKSIPYLSTSERFLKKETLASLARE